MLDIGAAMIFVRAYVRYIDFRTLFGKNVRFELFA